MELAKSKYAHHIVNKMMKYGNKEKVIGRLLGHCFELLKHQFGASVVEEAFSERANGRQRCAMVEEFYGAEFAAFKPEKKRTLSEVLTAAPAKRGPVLRRLKDELSALLNKPHVPDSTLFHHVAAAYFSVCDAADALEMETLLRDSLARMVHTREGVCVALRCVEVATAKDRKAMIKGLKGHVTDACRDSQAHLYVMALLDRTDDTTLLRAALLEPMAEDLRDLATHTYGHLPLLHLLAPRSSRYFHPVAIRDMTFPTEGTPASTSKKPAQQRRAELLDYLLPHLVALAKESAADLLSSLYGSRVLAETLWAQAISPADTQAIAAAIAAAYAQTPTNNNNNDGGGDDDVSVVAGKKAKKGKKRRHQEDLAEDYQDHLNDSSEEEGDGNDGNDGNGDNNNSGGGNGNGGDDESTTTTTTVTVTAPGVSPVGNRWIQKALKDEDPAHAEKVAALWKALFVALRDVLGAWAKHKRLSFIVATLVATAPKYSGDNKKAFKECVAAQIPLKSLVGTQLPGQKLLIEAIKAL